MNNDKQTKDFSLSSFIKLIKSTNPSIWMLSVGIFGSLLATITNLALPLFARNVIDGVSLELLNVGIIIGIILLFIFRVAFDAFSNYLLSKAGQQVVARLREKMRFKLIRMPAIVRA